MPEIPRHETMWATMQPDCYGGATCDQIEPRWRCFAEGDKDSEHSREPLVLAPESFPPGTKITVAEPVCPNCGEFRHRNAKAGFQPKCQCGFDWDAWTLNQFS